MRTTLFGLGGAAYGSFLKYVIFGGEYTHKSLLLIGVALVIGLTMYVLGVRDGSRS